MWHEPIDDPELFDPVAFAAELDRRRPLPRFKTALTRGRAYLIEQFHMGRPIKELVHKGAWHVDQLITQAWDLTIDSDKLALVAVGGYGRGELHPASDVDIMVLTGSRPKPAVQQQVEKFLTLLWDMGLEVGHSVRSVKECQREAKTDITIATNLMESRLICGERPLYDAMVKATGPRKIWPTRKFFAAKWGEQIERHQKFDETEHNLEPNIKEGPGGLRDIQMIGWVAKRHFNAGRLKELIDHKFLTAVEYQTLDSGRSFLWRVRFALHTITGRGEDRLLFDHQRAVARTFGYQSEDNSGVEQFMRTYYRTVRELSRLNEMLLQLFQEAIVYARRREKIKPLNSRFQCRNDFIEVRHRGIFKRYPFALLELFLLIQVNPHIQGVRASTVRLVRESLPLIDEKFRHDIRNTSLFLEILRQPRWVGHELRRMHRYGVLGAYLPQFAAIEGLMQFDLFHAYTVDEHILFVVRNLRRFGLPAEVRRFPLCYEIFKSIPKQELLCLAGLFHDLAKGRGGDHSTLGARDALQFCHQHRLTEYDARLVTWLVDHHLLMSKTAQREDINDPDVINRFAREVGDKTHLDYLYLLTVADISGTNPNLWNSWKQALLADLYSKTLLALRRGLENPIDKQELITLIKQTALDLLAEKIQSAEIADAVWAKLGEEYFVRHSADEIAWHTRAISKATDRRLPLILIREMTHRGGTEIFIYMRNHDNIFSRTARAMDRLGLNIVDARIITSSNDFTLDTFIVLEGNGDTVKGRERRQQIRNALKQALTSLERPLRKVTRVRSRTLRHFPIPTQVRFSNNSANQITVMEVTATDRPGILSAIGLALEFCGARLRTAKIATYGERVEDIFFITDRDNRMIEDEVKLECLTRSIIDNLSA